MKFIIRADGSPSIGTGHIFRTLALARQLKCSNHTISYLCKPLIPALEARLVKEGFKVQHLADGKTFDAEIPAVLDIVKEQAPEWVIVDHYEVKEKYYDQLKQLGCKVLAIDDINHTKFPINILLNQNIYAEEIHYSCSTSTRSLMGPQYALIDEVYEQKRTLAKPRSCLKKVLIFMGGADKDNQTLKALQAVILSGRNVEVNIVLGSAYQFEDALRQAIALTPQVRIYKDLPHLADLMLEADLAIVTAGSTCWQMCCVYLPMLLISVADNQVPVGQGIARAGAGRYLGTGVHMSVEQMAQTILSIEDDELKSMSQKAGAICDGAGVKRVIASLRNIILRPAGLDDLDITFQWVNETLVRQNSLNTEKIAMETHRQWFLNKLHNPQQSRIFIAEVEDEGMIGQIRFDRQQDKILMDYSLDARYRGQGLGSLLVELGITTIGSIWKDAEDLLAVVKPQNIVSQKIFEKNGFKLNKRADVLEYAKAIPREI